MPEPASGCWMQFDRNRLSLLWHGHEVTSREPAENRPRSIHMGMTLAVFPSCKTLSDLISNKYPADYKKISLLPNQKGPIYYAKMSSDFVVWPQSKSCVDHFQNAGDDNVLSINLLQRDQHDCSCSFV